MKMSLMPPVSSLGPAPQHPGLGLEARRPGRLPQRGQVRTARSGNKHSKPLLSSNPL